jgi:hypothetical protein
MEPPQLDVKVPVQVPAGRYADPAEMVGTLIDLLAPASDFVTG